MLIKEFDKSVVSKLNVCSHGRESDTIEAVPAQRKTRKSNKKISGLLFFVLCLEKVWSIEGGNLNCGRMKLNIFNST